MKQQLATLENHTVNERMLKTNNDKVIVNENILIKSSVQDFCIEHHDVKSQITSINAAENPDQSETQNSDIK